MVQIAARKNHIAVSGEGQEKLVRWHRGRSDDPCAPVPVKGVRDGLVQCGTHGKEGWIQHVLVNVHG